MRKDCVYKDKCYHHGATLRETGESLICMDGQWEKELGQTSHGQTIAPGKDLTDI